MPNLARRLGRLVAVLANPIERQIVALQDRGEFTLVADHHHRGKFATGQLARHGITRSCKRRLHWQADLDRAIVLVIDWAVKNTQRRAGWLATLRLDQRIQRFEAILNMLIELLDL